MILLAIADNADDFGFGFPSHDTIAQKSCCDRRTVIRRLDDLESEGWLRVLRKAVNGKGNLYWIDLGKIGVYVSPEARKSPMITRLLKASGVSESPIFWPQKSGDREEFSGDNPQPTQVTPVQGHVTPVQGQVTQLSHTNHQSTTKEPSGTEPSTEVELPPTPQRGVSGLPGMRSLGAMRDQLERELDSEPETARESPAVYHSPKVQAQFGAFRCRLQEDLSGVPASLAKVRFGEIEPGTNDFDACFRDWSLLDVRLEETFQRGRPAGQLFTVVTWATDPERTRQGFQKYGPRLQHRAREYFELHPTTSVRFEIADANTKQQPAA